MTNLRSLCNRLKQWALAALCWTAVYNTAWAQDEEVTGGGDKGTSWIIPYFFVVFCVGLGMLVVCRSARRRDRAKPEGYEGAELAGKSQSTD